MYKVTVEELRQQAASARESIWAQAKAYGREPKIYLHWSAGHHFQKFDDYHVNITADGQLWSNGDLAQVLSHTWRRNSGSVGISLCCAYLANTCNLGDEPPTKQQIEAMAQAIEALAGGLWLTIDKAHVLTHSEAADNEDGIKPHDSYGARSTCERWDLEYLGTAESPKFNPWATDGSRGGDVLRGKANWYRNKLKSK